MLLFSSLTREDYFITFGETSQTFDEATSLKPVFSSRLVSLIVLSQQDKAFFTSLRNFKSYSPNRRNSICFMMCGWKRTYEKVWESFKHLLTFQPILTIQTDLRRIRINCSNSKHCHIF